jgi:hypothetical protein
MVFAAPLPDFTDSQIAHLHSSATAAMHPVVHDLSSYGGPSVVHSGADTPNAVARHTPFCSAACTRTSVSL